MISLTLARRLKAAGLTWEPQLHDYFAIPERGMDARVFVISDLQANIESLFGSEVVAFQGASEWALDYLVAREAIWLPREEQLREILMELLSGEVQPAMRLDCSPGKSRCKIRFASRGKVFEAPQASEAYGLALLHLLESGAALDDVPTGTGEA